MDEHAFAQLQWDLTAARADAKKYRDALEEVDRTQALPVRSRLSAVYRIVSQALNG